MTALALRVRTVGGAVAARRGLWLAITFGFPLVYYPLLLVALMVRFEALPNYAVLHDWPGNVAEIVRATPAVADMAPIIIQEWLLEVGRMNYDYGHGISEWSLTIIPAKAMVVLLLSALTATLAVLMLQARRHCAARDLRGDAAAGGLGAALMALTGVTLYWVVCCSYPTWVVGLAMLGLGVSTSLWLEQFGWWIGYAGCALLLAAIWRLSGRQAAAEDAARSSEAISTTMMGATGR